MENLHGGLQGVIMTSTALQHEDVPRHQMGLWDKSDMCLYNLGTRSCYTCTYQLWDCKHMSFLVNWIFIYKEAKSKEWAGEVDFGWWAPASPQLGKRLLLLCAVSVDRAEGPRRNGRRMRKPELNKAGVVGERRDRGSKGEWRRRRGSRKMLGWGMHSLLSCPTSPRGQSLLCILGMLWRGAVAEPAWAGSLQCSAWDCSKRRGGSTRGEMETGKHGKRQGLWHLCSLKTALTAFSNCTEMEVRCFETLFYLAQFYSNLPWGQKHSFSICQKVVLLTLKCQTVIGGWIQNWLLQRSDNSQF